MSESRAPYLGSRESAPAQLARVVNGAVVWTFDLTGADLGETAALAEYLNREPITIPLDPGGRVGPTGRWEVAPEMLEKEVFEP